MTRNPIARHMNKTNKPAVIPDKRNQLLEDMYEQEKQNAVECELNGENANSECDGPCRED